MTCLADTLFPSVGRATVEVLERLGVEVGFARAQTCCGQMHFNSGYVAEARRLALRFGEVFDGTAGPIVTPSASCAGHVREVVPGLARSAAAAAAAERVVELSELLTRDFGLVDVGSPFAGRVALHPTCHSLRVLRVGDGPVRLLDAVPGVERVELPDADTCCGFGGTFAVKNHRVSAAMLEAKLAAVEASGAEVVCACDTSCLMHIGGGLSRRGSSVRALHLAEVLAG